MAPQRARCNEREMAFIVQMHELYQNSKNDREIALVIAQCNIGFPVRTPNAINALWRRYKRNAANPAPTPPPPPPPANVVFIDDDTLVSPPSRKRKAFTMDDLMELDEERFEEITKQRNQYQQKKFEAKNNCSVCMESDVGKAVIMSCGHTTCLGCFNEWRKRQNTCPFCRAKTTMSTTKFV